MGHRIVGVTDKDMRIAVEPPLRDAGRRLHISAEVPTRCTPPDPQVIIRSASKHPKSTGHLCNGGSPRAGQSNIFPNSAPPLFIAPPDEHAAGLPTHSD